MGCLEERDDGIPKINLRILIDDMEVVEFLHTVIAFYKEFSQLNGQLGSEYRDFRFRQKIWQGPNGIRMTMGQENTRNAVLVFK